MLRVKGNKIKGKMKIRRERVLMAESSDIYHDGRVLKQAHALADEGFNVEVLGFKNVGFKTKDYPFKILAIPVIGKKFRMLRNINIVVNIILINIIIFFRRADVYHSHNTMFLGAMYYVQKLYRAKLVYDCHEVQWELNPLAAFIEQRFIQRIYYIINVSEGRARAQIERFRIKPETMTIISNYPVIGDKKMSQISNDTKIFDFVFSGGFDLSDNRLDNFIRALQPFEDCSLKLLAFGYRDSLFRLESLIKELNMANRVEFLPLVDPDQVVLTIQKFDVAVNLLSNPKGLISYQYHGINKIYEYLVAGLPILCSNMSSFKEEIEDTGVGKCVDPLDLNSIREGIRFFLNQQERLAEMKNSCREVAVSNFNWASERKKLVKLYNKICAE